MTEPQLEHLAYPLRKGGYRCFTVRQVTHNGMRDIARLYRILVSSKLAHNHATETTKRLKDAERYDTSVMSTASSGGQMQWSPLVTIHPQSKNSHILNVTIKTTTNEFAIKILTSSTDSLNQLFEWLSFPHVAVSFVLQ